MLAYYIVIPRHPSCLIHPFIESDVLFTDNTGRYGGAVFAYGEVTLSNVGMEGNTATDGGAVRMTTSACVLHARYARADARTDSSGGHPYACMHRDACTRTIHAVVVFWPYLT